MKKPSIERIIELQKLLLAFQKVDRVVHLEKKDLQVQENDVEHSYSLAMVAWYLSQYFPNLDKDKVIRMALAHDLVEIHAGDTYAFGAAEDLASKKDREHVAFIQIKKDWPDLQDVTDHIEQYESLNSEEAKFVYALDKIMPIMMIFINKGYTWQEEKLTLEILHINKLSKISLSPEISELYIELYELLKKNRHLFHTPGK